MEFLTCVECGTVLSGEIVGIVSIRDEITDNKIFVIYCPVCKEQHPEEDFIRYTISAGGHS